MILLLILPLAAILIYAVSGCDKEMREVYAERRTQFAIQMKLARREKLSAEDWEYLKSDD